MVFNTTFNTISVISWQSVLLVEEIWENDLSEVSDKLDHRLSVPLFKPDKWHSLVLNNKNKLSEKLNADFYILITHYDLLSFNTIDFSVNPSKIQLFCYITDQSVLSLSILKLSTCWKLFLDWSIYLTDLRVIGRSKIKERLTHTITYSISLDYSLSSNEKRYNRHIIKLL